MLIFGGPLTNSIELPSAVSARKGLPRWPRPHLFQNRSFLGQRGILAGSPVAGRAAFASGPFGGEAALFALDMAGQYVLLLYLIVLRLGRKSLS